MLASRSDGGIALVHRRNGGNPVRLRQALDQAGQVLMRQRQPGHECMIVCSGRVAITRDDGLRLAATRGDVVEAVAMLEHESATATAVAERASAVLVLTPDGFERLEARLPLVAVRLYKAAIRQVALTLMAASEPAALSQPATGPMPAAVSW